MEALSSSSHAIKAICAQMNGQSSPLHAEGYVYALDSWSSCFGYSFQAVTFRANFILLAA